MPKLLGRAAHLSIGTDRIGTLSSKTWSVNNAPIDVTTPPNTGDATALWAESMGGMSSVAISGDGVFSDSAGEAALRVAADAAGQTATFTIDTPRWGKLSGLFRVESLEIGGETEGAVTFSLSLMSVGAVSFARNPDITPTVAQLALTEGGSAGSYQLKCSVDPTGRIRINPTVTPSGLITLSPATNIDFQAGTQTKTVTVTPGSNVITADTRIVITHVVNDAATADSRFDGMVVDPVFVTLANA